MKLNCDLGEGMDQVDAGIMPLIDMANIACGGHAGDRGSMLRTIAMALEHGVDIGAHPSYPDRANFGRVSLDIEPEALFNSLQEQVGDLINYASELGAEVTYIKPHGALYNDAFRRPSTLAALLELSAATALPLMLAARPDSSLRQDHPDHHFILEAFVDRAYDADGTLVDRRQPYAVHPDVDTAVSQALSLLTLGGLTAVSGEWLFIAADTLCLHSDSPIALDTAHAVRRAMAAGH